MMGSSAEVAWAGSHFTVLRVPVTYADGTIHMHEQIEAPDVVRVYSLTNRRTIYLIREYRHDVDATVLRVPAGRVQSGEAALDAAHRELKEEAGIEAGSMRLLRKSQPVLKFRYNVWHYVATDLVETGQSLDHGENIDVAEYGTDTLSDLVFTGKITEDSLALSLLMIARDDELTSTHG